MRAHDMVTAQNTLSLICQLFLSYQLRSTLRKKLMHSGYRLGGTCRTESSRRELFKFIHRNAPHRAAHNGNCGGSHTQLMYSESEKQKRVDGVGSHLTADSGMYPVRFGNFDHVAYKLQHRRIGGAVEIRHLLVSAVDSHSVLNEVIGSYTEKINQSSQMLRLKSGDRSLYHNSEGKVGNKLFLLRSKLLLELTDDLARLKHLCHR